MVRYFVLCLLMVVVTTPSAVAIDLSKIERRIVKEPTYRDAPRYCLLALGPQAETHVWLVLDGTHLYIDRNVNGDLTDAGERLAVTNVNPSLMRGIREFREFFDRDKETNGRLHHRPFLTTTDRYYGFVLRHFVPSEDSRSKSDADKQYPTHLSKRIVTIDLLSGPTRGQMGQVIFSDRADDAPILRFDGGPYVFEFADVDSEKDRELKVRLVAYGLGEVTRTVEDHVSVPADVFPTAELEFAGNRKVTVPLKGRC